MFINPAPVPDPLKDLKGIIIAIVVAAVVTFVATLFLYKDEQADKIDAQG
jgi:CDP-diglyceride synthetase